MDHYQQQLFTAIRASVLFVAGIAITAAMLTGCNVTRTVTTKSEFQQRGDTTIVIQTKTTETYDGSVKK